MVIFLVFNHVGIKFWVNKLNLSVKAIQIYYLHVHM